MSLLVGSSYKRLSARLSAVGWVPCWRGPLWSIIGQDGMFKKVTYSYDMADKAASLNITFELDTPSSQYIEDCDRVEITLIARVKRGGSTHLLRKLSECLEQTGFSCKRSMQENSLLAFTFVIEVCKLNAQETERAVVKFVELVANILQTNVVSGFAEPLEQLAKWDYIDWVIRYWITEETRDDGLV